MTLDDIKRLIEFLREQDLTEFELDQDGVKLRVEERGARAAIPAPAPCGRAQPPRLPRRRRTTTRGAPVATPSGAPAPRTTDRARHRQVAHRRHFLPRGRARPPQPFVELGDTVKKGQVLCIIEAMKLMNEIDSEYDGEVVSIYVENGQAVQYGERLFAIRLK